MKKLSNAISLLIEHILSAYKWNKWQSDKWLLEAYSFMTHNLFFMVNNNKTSNMIVTIILTSIQLSNVQIPRNHF